MTTTTGNESYNYHRTDWQTVRDCLAGERKVKERGELYLPRLSSKQKDHQYNAYRDRARFVGITSRTLEGFVGSAFRKAPSVEVPDALQPFLDDIDLAATTFEEFCLELAEEVLSVGRAGVLVERQSSPSGRSYLLSFKAEEIVDWCTTVIDGRRVLSYVELVYCVDDAEPGQASSTHEERRILRLVGGVYTQEVYRYEAGDKKKESGWVSRGAPITPLLRGTPLGIIPFVFLGPKGTKPEIEEPPLLKISQANIHHYKASADWCQGLHMMALPTPFSVNAKTPGETTDGPRPAMEFGPGVFHEFEGENVQFAFAEVQGNGMTLLREDLQDLKEEMAGMGAAFISVPKRAAETAEALQLKSAANNSPLAKILSALEKGLTQALRWLGRWEGVDETAIEVRLNKDFDSTKLSSADLQAMMAGLQNGSLTAELFAYQLEQSEMLPPGVDAATYAAQLNADKEARQAKAAQISGAAPEEETPSLPPTA